MSDVQAVIDFLSQPMSPPEQAFFDACMVYGDFLMKCMEARDAYPRIWDKPPDLDG